MGFCCDEKGFYGCIETPLLVVLEVYCTFWERWAARSRRGVVEGVDSVAGGGNNDAISFDANEISGDKGLLCLTSDFMNEGDLVFKGESTSEMVGKESAY